MGRGVIGVGGDQMETKRIHSLRMTEGRNVSRQAEVERPDLLVGRAISVETSEGAWFVRPEGEPRRATRSLGPSAHRHDPGISLMRCEDDGLENDPEPLRQHRQLLRTTG